MEMILFILSLSAEILDEDEPKKEKTTISNKNCLNKERNPDNANKNFYSSTNNDNQRHEHDFTEGKADNDYYESSETSDYHQNQNEDKSFGLPDLPISEKRKLQQKKTSVPKSVFPDLIEILNNQKFINNNYFYNKKLTMTFRMALESEDLTRMINNLKESDKNQYRRLMKESTYILTDLLSKFQNPEIAKNPDNYQGYNKLSILYIVKRKIMKFLEKDKENQISIQKLEEKAISFKQQATVYLFDLFKNASNMYYVQHRKDIDTQMSQPLSGNIEKGKSFQPGD